MGIDLAKYFARIGYDGPSEPTLATLSTLVERHTDSIPFENLDPLAGRTVALDPESLSRKMLDDGRGGYCFEHNHLFQDALTTLGFDVTPLAGRVMWMVPRDSHVTARTHMLLRVDLADGPRIVDVGFGGVTLTGTVRLVVNEPQETPHERFRLSRVDRDFLLEVEIGDAWHPVYRFDLTRQHSADFEMSSWYLCNHPDSGFRRQLRVARASGGVRYALRDRTFTLHRRSGRREQRVLPNATALREMLTDTFGITVPDDPEIDAALERAASAPA